MTIRHTELESRPARKNQKELYNSFNMAPRAMHSGKAKNHNVRV